MVLKQEPVHFHITCLVMLLNASNDHLACCLLGGLLHIHVSLKAKRGRCQGRCSPFGGPITVACFLAREVRMYDHMHSRLLPYVVTFNCDSHNARWMDMPVDVHIMCNKMGRHVLCALDHLATGAYAA